MLLRLRAARQSQLRYDPTGIGGISLTAPHSTKVPLLDQAVDIGLTRSARNRRNPARFNDYIPTSTVPSQMNRQFLTKKQQAEAAKARAAAAQLEHPKSPENEWFDEDDNNGAGSETTREITSPDSFGVFRKYTSIPSHNPDDIDPFSDLSPALPGVTSPQIASAGGVGSNLNISSTSHDPDPLASSKNPTEDTLLGWWSEGSRDGIQSLNRLAQGLSQALKSPNFNPSQLEDFDAVTSIHRFERDHCFSKPGTTLEPGDGWKTGSVKVRLPCTGIKQREEDAPEFTVDGILYRDVVEVIARELEDPDSFERIHIQPFEEWWKPSESEDPVRVYSDVYTSDAMLEADRQLRDSLKGTTSAGPQLETFILSVLLYSDSTCLTAFSNATLWPMYMYIGNESKYVRSKPTSFAAHHIAYLPTVRGLAACLIHHVSHHFLPATGLDQGGLSRTL